MGSTARYVHWCHRVKGVPLSRERIFEPALIAEYANLAHAGRGSTTIGNHASRLQSITKTLNPGSLQPRPDARQPSNGRAPYSPTEEARLWAWAEAQPTAAARRDARTLIAGNLGAGLTAREICDLRVGDVSVDALGVTLRVSAPRVREVPLSMGLEHVFVKAIADAPSDAYVFKPQRAATSKNTASNFLATSADSKNAVNTQRGRATWVTRLLSAGIDVRALMTAMGVTDFSAIARYLAHVPDIDASAYRRQVRGQRPAA
ncbi:tyrosine-type recombinase/integrase [Demequina maris]|uniref:tyrosine-type recombinase/integrase n=1 Tax=Demequina maris TaxID=1638982 RepID=UPI0007851FF5|nr:tyrosine-type recombinase/integrase [Demequina maris]